MQLKFVIFSFEIISLVWAFEYSFTMITEMMRIFRKPCFFLRTIFGMYEFACTLGKTDHTRLVILHSPELLFAWSQTKARFHFFFRIKRFLAWMRTLVAFLRVYYIPESTFQVTQFAGNSYEKQTIKFSETRNSKLNRKTETMNQSSFFSLFARFQNFVQNRCSSGRFHLFTARSRVERETARS